MSNLLDPNAGNAPVGWRRQRGASPANDLRLDEKVIVRRMQDGQKSPEIARALGYRCDSSVRQVVRRAKARLGVTNDAELFAFL